MLRLDRTLAGRAVVRVDEYESHEDYLASRCARVSLEVVDTFEGLETRAAKEFPPDVDDATVAEFVKTHLALMPQKE